MNGGPSDFRYWLSYNTLVSSEGITMLQKPFSHALLCDSSLFFVLQEWRQFKQ